MMRAILRWRWLVPALLGYLVGGPVLVVLNCHGWNEGTMAVTGCLVDTPGLREAADTIYAIGLVSAFTLGLPLILYGLAVRWIVRRVRRAQAAEAAATAPRA